MLQDIYYSRRSNKAVQVITQCRMLPDGTEAICFQEMSGDYEVFVLAKEHFMKIFQKPDESAKEIADRQEEYAEEKNAADWQEESAEEKNAADRQEEIVTEEEEAEPGIIRFLDAETYEEKMKVLESMRDDLDERTLNNMAVSLDLTINDGADAYAFLMSELRIRSRYEGKRGQRL